MNITPKISVVMTAYNAERFIGEAIQSILNQTFSDFEFIIVDNRSQDGTARVVASFKDSRIIFIQNEQNLGQTKALNVGIRKSRTDYVARMDADDVAYPERLAVQYEFMENHPDIALVGSACLDIDENGKSLRVSNVPTDLLAIRCYLLGSGDLTSWCINHPTVLMRKSAVEDVGFYDEQKSFDGYPQDYALWRKLSVKFNLANIARPLMKYRILKRSESKIFFDKSCVYRYQITFEHVALSLPYLLEREKIALAEMLEYRAQSFCKEGQNVFKVFDLYFDATVEKSARSDKAAYFCDQMKFYYLPKLFLTNKGLAVKEFFRLTVRRPACFFDIRFYRKVMKVLLQSLLPSRWYGFFTKDVLSYR